VVVQAQTLGMTDRGAHWDAVYDANPPDQVSWFERKPSVSLRLVESLASGPSAAVIDVGGGSSRLVDCLLEEGFADLTVLDVSERALASARARLGPPAKRVSFLHADVVRWEPARQFSVWHDRAVFHFLTARRDRDRYVEAAQRAVHSGGALVLATFAPDGPDRCSGLPVLRYSAAGLTAVFAPAFSLVEQHREVHRTPEGVDQPFTWAVFRRT
jgi:trans-aconitate methyltransferase